MNHAKIDFGGDEIFGANLANAAFSLAVTENVATSRDMFLSPYYTLDGLVIYEINKPYNIIKDAFSQAATLFLADKRVNSSLRSYIDPLLREAVSDIPEPERTEHNFVMNGNYHKFSYLAALTTSTQISKHSFVYVFMV